MTIVTEFMYQIFMNRDILVFIFTSVESEMIGNIIQGVKGFCKDTCNSHQFE